MVAAAALFGVGFFWFLWSVPSDEVALTHNADGIVVLTGGASRVADAIELMAAGRQVALVSGTNGKTTTTRLLAAALARQGSVTTNSAGANLLSGLVATLTRTTETRFAALEVDEGLLARATSAVKPQKR